jgi:hypothetical protein
MFSIPRANVIQSDSGFSVEILGRTGLRYTEGDRSLHVDSEVVAEPTGLVVYSQTLISWDAPTGTPINEIEKEIIIANIREAFLFREFDIEVV